MKSPKNNLLQSMNFLSPDNKKLKDDEYGVKEKL